MWFLSAFTVCKWMLNAAFHTCDSLSKKTSYFKSIGWFFVPFLLLLMMMKRTRFFKMFIIFTESSSTHAPTNIRANTRIQNTLALLYAQQWSDFDKLKARFFFSSLNRYNELKRTLCMNKCHPLKYKHIQSPRPSHRVCLVFFSSLVCFIAFFYFYSVSAIALFPVINKLRKK